MSKKSFVIFFLVLTFSAALIIGLFFASYYNYKSSKGKETCLEWKIDISFLHIGSQCLEWSEE